MVDDNLMEYLELLYTSGDSKLETEVEGVYSVIEFS